MTKGRKARKAPGATVTDAAGKSLPEFKPATPNQLKAPKVDNRQVKAIDVKVKVVAAIEKHHGKATWNELLKSTGASPRLLGLALKDLMGRKLLTGPKTEYEGWADTAQYRVAKVRQQLAA